jgi:hypothetical protein
MAMPKTIGEPGITEEDERSRELIASGASLSEIADMLVRAEWATKARTEPGSHASSKLPVNKLTWAQVGLVTEPGRHMFKFGWLTVTAEDLAVWKQFPSAAFTLYSTGAQPGDETAKDSREEFRLDSNCGKIFRLVRSEAQHRDRLRAVSVFGGRGRWRGIDNPLGARQKSNGDGCRHDISMHR